MASALRLEIDFTLFGFLILTGCSLLSRNTQKSQIEFEEKLKGIGKKSILYRLKKISVEKILKDTCDSSHCEGCKQIWITNQSPFNLKISSEVCYVISSQSPLNAHLFGAGEINSNSKNIKRQSIPVPLLGSNDRLVQ